MNDDLKEKSGFENCNENLKNAFDDLFSIVEAISEKFNFVIKPDLCVDAEIKEEAELSPEKYSGLENFTNLITKDVKTITLKLKILFNNCVL